MNDQFELVVWFVCKACKSDFDRYAVILSSCFAGIKE
jgi:hypothetical protein